MFSGDLKAIRVSLETAAGASTTANDNEIGEWKRIAAASEVLAGASTTANETVLGLMRRTAIALEVTAGGSGAEENDGYYGLLKRIVDALEIKAGAVTTGSLEGRAVIAAANAVFAFNPLSLSPAAWWDFSDLSTLKQTGSRAAPGAAVAVNNDPIGLVLDKSGNNRDLVQATAGLRPLYQTGSGLHWSLFDGTDDGFIIAGNQNLPANADVFIAFYNSGAKTNYMPIDNAGSNFIGVAQSGNASATFAGSGTPTDFVNGIALSPATRDGLFTTMGSAAPKVLEIRNVDFSTWTTNFRMSQFAGFLLGGRMYGFLIYPALSADNRGKVRTWLGAKAGLVL